MFFGAFLACLLCNAGDVIRADGTRVILMKHPSWWSEIKGMYESFRFEPLIILLFPMFFVSNWFYPYQQNSVNGAVHNVRTRSLNSLLYWLAQIVAAGIWGYTLDLQSVRRSTLAKANWAVLVVLTFAVWGGGYAFEKTYTRETVSQDAPVNYVGKDWTDSGYIGPMFLYIFYGFYDAAWQASVYWYVPDCPFLVLSIANITGSWALSPTLAAALPTTSAFTRVSSRLVPLLSTTWMLASSRIRRSSSATGFCSLLLSSSLSPLYSSRSRTTLTSRKILRALTRLLPTSCPLDTPRRPSHKRCLVVAL